MTIVFAGAKERLEREHHGRAWLAWHICAIPKMKKFPALEALMGTKRVVRQQTPEEMDAVFRRSERL